MFKKLAQKRENQPSAPATPAPAPSRRPFWRRGIALLFGALWRTTTTVLVTVVLVAVLVGGYRWFTAWQEAQASDEPTATTIHLIQDSWSASVAHNAVAKIVLEEELGYNVEIARITDEEEQARALITGEASANLEIWPNNISSAFERYLNAGIVANMGPLGVSGRGGWYVPNYLREDFPGLTRWQVLTQTEVVRLFSTETSGAQGVLLSGDASWENNLEDIIRNLGLNFEVVYTGSESTLVQTIDRAYENQLPVLFYFVEPHPIHDRYNLVRLRLPEYSDDCFATAEVGGIDCDYPSQVLIKVAYPGLESEAPAAFAFVRNFYYPTVDDYLELMIAVEESTTPESGARRWMADHPEVWRSWLEGE